MFSTLIQQSLATTPLSDEKLWQNLQTGDERAFSALFERYYPQLLGYGNTLLSDSEIVKDCVQNVFMDVWRYRHSLADKVVVKTYLLSSLRKRIARQNERDHFFRKTTPLDSVEFSLDFSIEDQLIFDEETAAKVQQLNGLINALPARQKEALYLRYHQGLAVDQIAEILHINNQSVSNLLHRAILCLRKDWVGDLPLILVVCLQL